MLALSACATHTATPDQFQIAASSVDWSKAQNVTVKLTDFAFTPSHLNLQSSQPVRLILINSGTDIHDFSSPGFFAAAAYRQGSTMPKGGRIAVAKDQSAEIDLVPGGPGQYPLECTEFLHTLFGMTGAITVSADAH
jgi:uncharacterized cupredoxin-like copper-binding protein